LEERHWGQELLIETEGDDAYDSKYEHGNDVVLAPSVRRGTSEVERNQGQNKTSEKEKRAEDCKRAVSFLRRIENPSD
jgi:hypothetical protein